jgi:hypothetical protein
MQITAFEYERSRTAYWTIIRKFEHPLWGQAPAYHRYLDLDAFLVRGIPVIELSKVGECRWRWLHSPHAPALVRAAIIASLNPKEEVTC